MSYRRQLHATGGWASFASPLLEAGGAGGAPAGAQALSRCAVCAPSTRGVTGDRTREGDAQPSGGG